MSRSPLECSVGDVTAATAREEQSMTHFALVRDSENFAEPRPRARASEGGEGEVGRGVEMEDRTELPRSIDHPADAR